jgi:hypothetical protein
VLLPESDRIRHAPQKPAAKNVWTRKQAFIRVSWFCSDKFLRGLKIKTQK